MTKIKRWLFACIPKYVSNGFLLAIYRLFSVFGVPEFIREKNYRENCIRLEQTNWGFWHTPDIYIENQNEWETIRFGMGRHHNMRYSGCEIIAACNAWRALQGMTTRKQIAEFIRDFEAQGAALMGVFGVAPTVLASYFRKNGFFVETADGTDVLAAEKIGRSHSVMIATVYNDKVDITKQIHTVCITKNRDGRFLLHNAYFKDRAGQYRESDPYETVGEAVAHISRREPKLIYLIGIRHPF